MSCVLIIRLELRDQSFLFVTKILIFIFTCYISNFFVLELYPQGPPLLSFTLQTRHLLQPEKVLEDVSQDHAHKTVCTQDPFDCY